MTMLTPAEELGLSGLSFDSRVRKVFYALPQPLMAELLDRMTAEAWRRKMIYLREGQAEAVRDAEAAAVEVAKLNPKIRKAPKIDWKKNALRHSFISYRVAKSKDVAGVALEAGNSPKMIFEHYRELVTPKEATEWFGIVPATGKPNITSMEAAA